MQDDRIAAWTWILYMATENDIDVVKLLPTTVWRNAAERKNVLVPGRIFLFSIRIVPGR
jgi:hypothetical protein